MNFFSQTVAPTEMRTATDYKKIDVIYLVLSCEKTTKCELVNLCSTSECMAEDKYNVNT